MAGWLVGIPKCEACAAGQHRLGLSSHFGAMSWPSDARSMLGPADQGGHLGPCLFSLGPGTTQRLQPRQGTEAYPLVGKLDDGS